MKSIFKKIALVLALAMVVTMLPAKAASVAAADASANKWVRKTCTLYLDAPVPKDKYNTYVSEAYATKKAKIAKDDADGWGTKGYTVSFDSENPSVASVGKKYGKVTAEGIGQTTITATFSKEGEEDIVEFFPVTVKSYAHSIALDQESEDALNALVVGSDPITLKAVVTDAEGNAETVDKVGGDTKLAQLLTERKYVTDYIKFKVTNPEDKEVLEYDEKANTLTAVGAGKATLTAIAYRWDWTPNVKTNSGWYAWRTTEKAYEVEVAEAKLEAEQTAYDAITITFGSEEDAKTAIDASKPALNSSDAAVTEKKEIIKIYRVLENSNDSEVTKYFKGLAQDGNKVIVTLFEEMDENAKYIVRYQDQVIDLFTGEYIADDMAIVIVKNESLGEDSSKTTLGFRLYTTGKNGQDVDITGAKKYAGWDGGVDLEDQNKEPYHAEYTFDANARIIWFFTKSESYQVNLKATFDDWYTATGSTAKQLTAYKSVHPGDLSSVVGDIIDWGILSVGGHIENNDKAFTKKEFAAEDIGRMLVVQISYKDAGDDKKVNSCDSNLFEFISSNDDKLAINKDTGELYPPKEPTGGTVLVHIYYDKQYVGSVAVRVHAKRVFSGFTAELSDSKLNYNSDDTKGVNDTLTLTLKPVDQLGDPFNNVICDATLNGTTANQYIHVDGSGLSYTVTAQQNPSKLTNTVMNFRIVCTATYDDGQSPKITRKYSVAFAAKDTKGMDPKSYKLVSADKVDKVDMKLDTKDDIAKKAVEITAYSYDRDGFKIEKLPLTAAYGENGLQTANGSSSVAIRLGNDYVDSDHLKVKDSKTLVFNTVLGDQIATITSVSGSAITGSAIEANNVITKVKEGTYSVNLFIGSNGKAVYKNSLPIAVSDSQPKPTWTWARYTTMQSDVLGAVRDCFNFSLNNNDETQNILIRMDEAEGDYKLRGNTLTVQKVRRLVYIGDQVFEQVIDIKRSVTLNVAP